MAVSLSGGPVPPVLVVSHLDGALKVEGSDTFRQAKGLLGFRVSGFDFAGEKIGHWTLDAPPVLHQDRDADWGGSMEAGLWYVVVFSLVIGVAIPAFWVTAVLSGGVPELAEGNREIWFHIAAEILTGIVLIAGGVATWASDGSTWSALISCLGLGMLAYTVIVSPGYYADRKNWPMVGMFAAVWLGATAAIAVRLAA